MGRPLLYDMWDRPITSLTVFACTMVWFYLNNLGLGYADVGLSYEKVVQGGEYWRIATSTFSHISLIHLLFNMSSIWSLGVIETNYGVGIGLVAYIRYTLVLIVVPLLLVLLIQHFLIYRLRREEYLRSHAVGYSCVVFGWMTLMAQYEPTGYINLFGVLPLPYSIAPFGSLLFTSIIVPQASFIGHLAGIITGYLISWGAFSWIDDVLTWNLFVWLVIGFVVNLKHTNAFPALTWFVTVHEGRAEAAVAARITAAGQVVRAHAPAAPEGLPRALPSGRAGPATARLQPDDLV